MPVRAHPDELRPLRDSRERGAPPGAVVPAEGVLALGRTIGNHATARLLSRQATQTAPPTGAAPVVPAPRQDFVFVMGADRPGTANPFYEQAEAYYRSHLPSATFVTTLRTMVDVLSHVASNASQPLGNLYIISHANEDGTLSFGLDAADADGHLNVRELRDALHPASGSSSLPQVGKAVDATTRIHIKGCDIGRTQAMVELIDEAFGGAGEVTAPTHEQVYGMDATLADAERRRFRTQVEASHPAPAPVDATLKGPARRQAETERRTAVQERQRAIQAELVSRHGEQETLAELAGRYEALSGPMFQRSGTTLYSRSDVQPEVDRLYGHLSVAQRASLVGRLVTPDPRPAATAATQGTFQQQGQRVDRRRPWSQSFLEPKTTAEADRALGSQYPPGFRSGHVTNARVAVSGGFDLHTEITGTIHEAGEPDRPETLTFDTPLAVADDASMRASAERLVSNPGRYAWRFEETHKAATGETTRTVVIERVVAYLHHASLDASAHDHFGRPLTDSSYYAHSTFAPPATP